MSAVLVLLVLAVGAFVLTAVRTEWGARTLWSLAGRILPGTLSGTVAGGTLADGLQLRDVLYRDKLRVVRIDSLAGAWHLSLSPRRLDIAFLKIGKVDVTLLPSPPTPLTLPDRITLPLELDLKRAAIARIVVHGGTGETSYDDIRLAAGSDRVHHRLRLDRAVTPYGTVRAGLQLDGNAPFPVSGDASLVHVFQEKKYDVDATVTGTLRAPGISLRAAGGTLDGTADIDATPFDPVPFRRAQIAVSHLDPRVFSATAPQADLSVRATLSPVAAPAGSPAEKDLSKLVVAGPVMITNAAGGPLNEHRLPLVSAAARVTLDAKRQLLDRLDIVLSGNARITGSGALHGATDGNLKLQVGALDLHALHGVLIPTRLEGPIDVGLAGGADTVVVALKSPALSISAEAHLDATAVTLRSARVEAFASQLTLAGSLRRDMQSGYAVRGALKDFDPAVVLAQVQRAPAAASKTATGKSLARPAGKPAGGGTGRPVHAKINMDFSAEGALQPHLAAKVRFDIHDSVYDRLPMTGSGALQASGKRLVSSDVKLSVAGNQVVVKGGFGAPADRLDFRIAAPALERLGFGLAGFVQAEGRLAGSVDHPVLDATYQARGLVIGANRLAQLAGEAHVDGVPGQNPLAKLALTIDARGVRGGPVDLDRLDARVAGTYARHTIDVTASGRLSGQPLALTLAAQGALKSLPQSYAWDGTVRTLDNRGVPRVAIGKPLTVSVAPGRVELGATRLTLGPADIDLKNLIYRPGLIRSEGAFNGLLVADILELRRKLTGAAPPVKTTLALDGKWNVTLADTATGFVQLDRRGGDIVATTPYGESTIGMGAMRLRADLQGTRMALTSRIEASRVGTLGAEGTIGLVRADAGSGTGLTIGPASPLSVRLTGAMPKLRSLGVLTGPRIALDGSVALNLAATGTVGAPKFSGNVNGDRLGLTLFDQGVRLQDGTARITLDNNFVDLREVVFRGSGGAGTLRATGRIPLEPTGQNLTALITADKLALLTDPSKRLTLSGQARMANVDQQLQVTGRFTVDRALFSLPDKAAPVLSDDVVIVHQGAKPKAAAAPASGKTARTSPAPAAPGLLAPKINITVDLGSDFRFKGAGADIFLTGALDVRSGPGQLPQAVGTVRVVSGAYEAFGAKLGIERGLISFQGPFDNPSINVLAMRRNQAVPAGVQVTGTVRQPRVELVSEPNLAEEEKLSWLVFGHAGNSSAGTGQAQGAVQSAALGLLNKFGAGAIANKVGLDKVSIGSSEYGKTGAQVVNLGKEISNKLYVGYEQGLAGASSVVKLTYEWTQNWSVVVRGGAVTGLDVLYSRRFDRLGAKPGTRTAAAAPATTTIPATSR